MSRSTVVRRALPTDARGMAAVHIRSWIETYRGLMRDEVLDDPTLIRSRESFWTAALTDPRWEDNRVAVAEDAGSLVGIAMSGPTDEPGAWWTTQLHVLYVIESLHGAGVGTSLLNVVTRTEVLTALWVADPNPRAHAFYREHGFEPDGFTRIHSGVTEIRMTRASGLL